ncbi:MAG: sulfurtransferase [Gammaproteobacteria bacterium]|nr:sulfurtransferase [Gammaproteobacteria bacterium]
MNSFTEISTNYERKWIAPLPQAIEREPLALPLLLHPEDLLPHLYKDNVLIVDVRVPETCVDGHIPGAVSLPFQALQASNGVAKGLLPSEDLLTGIFSAIGLTPETHVVAYDDDSGTGASRLLWTLDMVGHKSFSLLNGGFAAWDEAELPLALDLVEPEPSRFKLNGLNHYLVEYEDVLLSIDNPDVIIVDTRSAGEFAGTDVRAARGGRIPGAINIDWMDSTDPYDNFHIRSNDDLRALFVEKGITPNKEIIVYCQTHHRSSHTYIILKHLGYPRVRAYAGSWSEWGNRSDVPIERND